MASWHMTSTTTYAPATRFRCVHNSWSVPSHFYHPPLPLPIFPLPASELELSKGKMGNNQRQIAVLPLPATLKWKGKCCRGCHPALSELRLADGCGAKMMHADGPVSVPRRFPPPSHHQRWIEHRRASRRWRPLRGGWQARVVDVFTASFASTGARF